MSDPTPGYELLASELVKRDARIERLEAAMQEACDLLAERKHGSQARSAGHNARLCLEAALARKEG